MPSRRWGPGGGRPSAAAAEVVTRGFAGLGRVAEDTEHVVAQLESLAQRHAVRGEAGQHVRTGAVLAGAEVQRTLNRVLGALVPSDPQRAGDRRAAERLLEQVEVLAGHQLDPHLVVDPLAADQGLRPVSYTHLRAHETPEHLVCRLL